MDSLRNARIDIDLFQIRNSGILGYLSSVNSLKKAIKRFKPDLIHAHYGFSGLLANFQRLIPVITTFHGSDLISRKSFYFSALAHRLSAGSIFVSDELKSKVSDKFFSCTIPCGVDISIFRPLDKSHMITHEDIKYSCIKILFSSAFNNPVKNSGLAKDAIDEVSKYLNKELILVELKNFDRKEVVNLINNVDCLLLTSFSEGSPQIIKEAMACNCPIVSTDVGDVRQVIGNTEGCYITNFDPGDVSQKIRLALDFSKNRRRTNGRERIFSLRLDSETVANRIIDVYSKVLKSQNEHL